MTFDQEPHLGSEVLEQYFFERLSEAECERVEEHLLICGQCQEELNRVETFIRDMKVACGVRKTKPEPEGESLIRRWLTAVPRPAMVTAFAAVVLAVSLPLMREAAPLAPASRVQLSVMRGPESAAMATAERRRPLQLHIGSGGLPNAPAYRIRIVNESGAPVWSGEPKRDGDDLVADVTAPLPDGTYWVRLFASGSDPVREFGLVVK